MKNATGETMPTVKAIVMTRIINASRQAVWDAWTNPEQYKKWWGPTGYTCPVATLDVNIGGRYHSAMQSPEGQLFWSAGTYIELVVFERIVCTDSFSDTEGNILNASELGFPGVWPTELLVTITFQDDSGKTKMTVRHEGLPEEMQQQCAVGWNESFDKLENVLATK
jgi:uncharacterized protein YndB with AHSA1/START domain